MLLSNSWSCATTCMTITMKGSRERGTGISWEQNSAVTPQECDAISSGLQRTRAAPGTWTGGSCLRALITKWQLCSSSSRGRKGRAAPPALPWVSQLLSEQSHFPQHCHQCRSSAELSSAPPDAGGMQQCLHTGTSSGALGGIFSAESSFPPPLFSKPAKIDATNFGFAAALEPASRAELEGMMLGSAVAMLELSSGKRVLGDSFSLGSAASRGTNSRD